MKNLLLGLLLIVSAGLSAQTMQGQWMVGGTAGFNSTSNDPDGGADAVTTFNLNPNIGYFVIDNLAIGLNLGFESHSGAGSVFSVGPQVRYYFVNLGESAKLFAQGRFGFASFSPEEGDSYSGTEWGVGVGLAYFLNPHVALEGLLEYSSLTPNSDFDFKQNTFGFNVGFQIHLGGE